MQRAQGSYGVMLCPPANKPNECDDLVLVDHPLRCDGAIKHEESDYDPFAALDDFGDQKEA